ncbi:MAG: ribosome silencing factor [Flavobacteriales bacterium]
MSERKIDRMKKKLGAESARLVDAVVEGIQEVKGKDIVHLDLRGVPNTVTDHLIICHGDSDTQVASITASVERFTLEKVGEKPWATEGQRNGEWVLLDYVNVVVHIFHRDKRSYYALEDLWGDGDSKRYENVA